MKVLVYRKSRKNGDDKDPTEHSRVESVGFWTKNEEFIQITGRNGYVLIPKEDIYRIKVEN